MAQSLDQIFGGSNTVPIAQPKSLDTIFGSNSTGSKQSIQVSSADLAAAQAGTAPAPGFKKDDSQNAGNVWSPVNVGGMNINPLTALRQATNPARDTLEQTQVPKEVSGALNAVTGYDTPVGKFIGNAGAHAAGAAGEGIGNLAGTAGQLAGLLGQKELAAGGEGIKNAMKSLADNARTSAQTTTGEGVKSASGTLGDFTGTLARILGMQALTPNAAAGLAKLTGASGVAETGAGGALNTLINSPVSTLAQSAVNTGKLPSAGDIAGGGLLDSIFYHAGQGLKGLQNLKENPDFFKQAKELGINEQDAHVLKNLPPDLQQSFLNSQEAALARVTNKNAPTVAKAAGKEAERFANNSKAILSDVGSKLGKAKDALEGQVVDTAPILGKLETSLKKAGVEISPKGALDFTTSKIKGGESDLENFYNLIKKNPSFDAKKLENITSQIDASTGLLKDTGYKGSLSHGVMKDLKSSINTTLKDVSPEFDKLNTAYAKLIKNMKPLKKSFGTGKDVFGDYNGEAFVNGLSGNASDKHLKALEAMQKIASDHGLAMPADQQTKAYLAKLAESTLGASQTNSINGIVSKVADKAQNLPVIGRAAGIVKHVADYAQPTEQLFNQAKQLGNLVKKGAQTNLPSPVLDAINKYTPALPSLKGIGYALKKQK